MLNQESLREYANHWAVDIDNKILSVGEIYNVDVINRSIETILSTTLGSRLFNIGFGSDFSLRIFDNMDISYLEQMIVDTADSIEYWEDRIAIIRDEMSIVVNADNNTVLLTIPYIIKRRKILAEFKKVISQ